MSKCAVCRIEYKKFSITHKCCGPDCALEYAKKQREKKERKELRVQREKLKTRAQWLKEAQQAVNAYIRERDKDEPCISCGRFHQGQWHAGHYLTVGARPELRFNTDNINKQCSPCNNHLSGNIVNYRINLIKKVGLEVVEWLEGPHEPVKYTIEDAKRIKAVFKKMLSELKGGGN